MKALALALFSLFLFSHTVYAQNMDTVQPDSLYKKYNIHYRTSQQGYISKAKQIFVFDKAGRVTGFVVTDNATGKWPQMVMAYEYDTNGRLLAEHDTSFYRNGKSIKEVKLTFDAEGSLIKKTSYRNGDITSEIQYSQKENKETESLYRYDAIYRVQTTYYDEHHKKIRFTGTEKADTAAKPRTIELYGKKVTISPANKDEQWDYIFKNSYDRQGNLISQQRLVNNKLQDETTFTYDDRGLLIRTKQSDHEDAEVFDYKSY
ncbi:YD repeat-containing protein [Mucilaginibacter yixingensis]|uniref:YD repeat-containing protein n=1 Tax=Mucilaginibacter yixingensis TaxID=1295612 RepID=A0A2T5J7Z4_9SPHI|nr:hypothetical protein [Mucilaginibacter yixingensis]PTQ95570.1 YD repeat-containing protein [Mucilaginibacter yixingensis]